MDKRGEGVSCARKLIGIKRTRGKQEQNLGRKWKGGKRKTRVKEERRKWVSRGEPRRGQGRRAEDERKQKR